MMDGECRRRLTAKPFGRNGSLLDGTVRTVVVRLHLMETDRSTHNEIGGILILQLFRNINSMGNR